MDFSFFTYAFFLRVIFSMLKFLDEKAAPAFSLFSGQLIGHFKPGISNRAANKNTPIIM